MSANCVAKEATCSFNRFSISALPLDDNDDPPDDLGGCCLFGVAEEEEEDEEPGWDLGGSLEPKEGKLILDINEPPDC